MRIDRVKLIAEMARQDMQQKELIKITGLSKATLSAIRGGKSCSPATAEKIAKGLNVSLDEVM